MKVDFKKSLQSADKPLVSVITTVLNGANHIEQAIQSVLAQTYDNLEYIIVDGGSTDGTVEIIDKYAEHLSCYLSEPDSGIYDGINKGIKLAKGDYIIVLNGDDYYLEDAIANLVAVALKTGADIVAGHALILDADDKYNFRKRSSWDADIYLRSTLRHEAMLVSSHLYAQIGLYDTAYKVIADWLWMIKAFEQKVKVSICDRDILCFRLTGISSLGLDGYDLRLKEAMEYLSQLDPTLNKQALRKLAKPYALSIEKISVLIKMTNSDKLKTALIKLPRLKRIGKGTSNTFFANIFYLINLVRVYNRILPEKKISFIFKPLIRFLRLNQFNPASGQTVNKIARRKIEETRKKLLELGIIERALSDMEDMAADRNDPYLSQLAARELARWHADRRCPDGARLCLDYLNIIKAGKHGRKEMNWAAIMEAECHQVLGDFDAARLVIRQVLEQNPDQELYLVAANQELTCEGKISWINKALEGYNLARVSIDSQNDHSPFDCLTALAPKADCSMLGVPPKVSVIITAYNAEATIGTALKSVLNQTWADLEVIVVDDCSEDDTLSVIRGYAAKDARVILIESPSNRGIYAARNAALSKASGLFVTTHDSDDWLHPEMIARQAQHLLEQPTLVANLARQAGMDSELNFLRRGDYGNFILSSPSSLMFYREKVMEAIGYWDSVRFGADKEIIRRIKRVFGEKAVAEVPAGPLYFKRINDFSLKGNSFFGTKDFLMGARREYTEAQQVYHENAKSLKYAFPMTERPFAVPGPMLPERRTKLKDRQYFDLIIVSDFRLSSEEVTPILEEIAFQKLNGSRIGLVQMSLYDLDPNMFISEEVRSFIDGEQVQLLVYGEKVACDSLIVYPASVLQDDQIYIPDVKANKLSVVINNLEPGLRSNELAAYLALLERRLQSYFGKAGLWYPAGPGLQHTLNYIFTEKNKIINLADEEWNSIQLRKCLEQLSNHNQVFYRRMAKVVTDNPNNAYLRALYYKSETEILQIKNDDFSFRDDRPLVSIIMPTYNRAFIIEEAVSSVIDQSYENWELLICDDGSDDDTASLLEHSFNDCRLKYFRMEKRSGAAAARNHGLRMAKGEIIAFLDTDNIWHPDYLHLMVGSLLKEKACFCVYANYLDVKIESDVYNIHSSNYFDFDYEQMADKNYIDLNSFIVYRELFDCLGGFDETLPKVEDWDLIAKFSFIYNPLHLVQLLVIYRRNEDWRQVTYNTKKDTTSEATVKNKIADYLSDGLPYAWTSKKPKITVVAETDDENGFRRAIGIADCLSAEHEVQLMGFCFEDGKNSFMPDMPESPKFSIEYVRPGKSHFPEMAAIFAEALTSVKGDLIYAVDASIGSYGFALLANHRYAKKVCLEVRQSPQNLFTLGNVPIKENINLKNYLDPHGEAWSGFLAGLALQAPTLITVEENISFLEGLNLYWLPDFCDEERLTREHYNVNECRRQFGLKIRDKLILLEGFFATERGLSYAADLCGSLNKDNFTFAAMVASRENGNALSERFGGKARIVEPHSIEDRARLYAASDLVLINFDQEMPHEHSRFLNTFTEAIAMQVPVIVTGSRILKEYAKKGYLKDVDYGSRVKLLQAVDSIFEYSEDTNEMIKKAYSLFLRKFSTRSARVAFCLIYERSISRQNGVLQASRHFYYIYKRVSQV